MQVGYILQGQTLHYPLSLHIFELSIVKKFDVYKA